MSHRVPIFRDNFSFHDRQANLFDDMRRHMDSGFGGRPFQRSFDSDFDRMCGDFYQLHPRDPVSRVRMHDDVGSSRENLDDNSQKSLFIEDPVTKSRHFQISFDVHEYNPNEICVKIQDDTLVVEAKHEQDKEGNKLINEFNRKFKIPKDVEPDKLQSVMSKDGILTISAPVPPKYSSITNGEQQQQQIGYTSVTNDQQPQYGRNSPSTSGPALGRNSPVTSGPPLGRNSPVISLQQQQMGRNSPVSAGQHSPISQMPGHSSPVISRQSSNKPVFSQKIYMVPTNPTTINDGVPVAVKNTSLRAKTPPLDTPTFYNTDKGCEMILLMDIGSTYQPDDLLVKVDGRSLTVEAEHIENMAGKKSKCSFSRQFELNEPVDPNTVTALLKEGRLKITGLAK